MKFQIGQSVRILYGVFTYQVMVVRDTICDDEEEPLYSVGTPGEDAHWYGENELSEDIYDQDPSNIEACP